MEDKIAAIIIIAVIIALFVVLGIVFVRGKGASLIAGYNTMPDAEKQKYDTESLLKFIGKAMFALSFTMILWILSIAYEVEWLIYLGIVLFIAVVIFIIGYANTGNRFKK